MFGVYALLLDGAQVLAAESAEEELAGAAGAAAAVSLVVGTDPSDKDLKPFHARSGGRHEDDTDDDDGARTSGLRMLRTQTVLPPPLSARLFERVWAAAACLSVHIGH